MTAPTRTGEPMPGRFFPAFRDEAELPASHDLGGQIRDALARSRFLIAAPRSNLHTESQTTS